MTGQNLLELSELDVFKDPVMDTIINEFTPDANAFLLTDNFLPFKLVDKEILLDLIKNGAFGRTNPVNLDADHKLISVPGYSYKEHTVGHWREGIQFGEEVLQRAVNPENPKVRAGEQLATDALNLLDLRLNVLIEYLTSKIVFNGSYSEARYGVNYTYDPDIPAKYYPDITGTVPWTTGGTWDTAASATPIADILGVLIEMRKAGIEPEGTFMSVTTMEKFYEATDTQNKINGAPQLVMGAADRSMIYNTLTQAGVTIDTRRYAEETTFTAASAATDTTLDLKNVAGLTVGDTITLRNSSGQEEDGVISDITNNVATVGAITYAYEVGDRVTAYLPFVPDNRVLFKGRLSARAGSNNWISTPSLVKSGDWKNPQPGRYTWSHFKSEKPPYWIEVGAGISGGPKVTQPTWFCLKVT